MTPDRPILPAWSRFRRSEHGGVAIEFAIISMLVVIVSLGAVEFGRALQLRNELSSLADRATREILMDASQTVTTAQKTAAEEDVRSLFQGPSPELLQIDLVDESVDGTSFRTLTLTYPVTLLIPKLAAPSITLSVERRTPVT